MRQFLVLFCVLGSVFAFSQQSGDSLSIQPVESATNGEQETVQRKIRIRADLGMTRAFSQRQSVEYPDYNYLLKDLKYSGVSALDVSYQLKDKGTNRVFAGVIATKVSGQKTMPNQTFVDSLSNEVLGSYQFKTSYSTLAVQIAGTRYLGKGESVSIWSALQVGKTWYNQEETGFVVTPAKGSSFTAGAMVGLDFKVSDRFAIGGELRGWYANITSLTYTDGEEELVVELEEVNKINLSRIDLTFGVRYWL